jgi:hypothetical protein
MASIIIDEIVPTKWRLRLRDADGKTREVEYRTGTPLQLDAVKPASDKRSDAAPTKKAEKPKPEKPKSERSKPADTDKPKTEATKAERSKSEDTDEKPATKPPQVRRRKHDAGPGPGGLVWEETEDDGVTGVRATLRARRLQDPARRRRRLRPLLRVEQRQVPDAHLRHARGPQTGGRAMDRGRQAPRPPQQPRGRGREGRVRRE